MKNPEIFSILKGEFRKDLRFNQPQPMAAFCNRFAVFCQPHCSFLPTALQFSANRVAPQFQPVGLLHSLGL